MEKLLYDGQHSKLSFKNVWLITNSFLLFASATSGMLGFENISGICGTIILLLSYPSHLIFSGLFFTLDNSFSSPAITFLMLLSFIGVGYLQWFILLPRLIDFFRRRFFSQDLKINLKINVEKMQQIAEPNLKNIRLESWQPGCYDENNNSPVERLIYNDKVKT